MVHGHSCDVSRVLAGGDVGWCCWVEVDDGLADGEWRLDEHRTFRSQYIIRDTIDQVDKDLYWSKIDETSFP